MAGDGWALIMLLSILSAAFVFATDPDHFIVSQLWDVTTIHHEQVEVILLGVAVIAGWAWLRANRKGQEGVVLHGPG